jgi:hypothetical protein
MTGAELLRAAADRLDELAGKATPGPWHVECSHGDPAAQVHLVTDVMRDRYGNNSVSTDDHATAAYIAAMHPEVGKALAAWLRKEADGFELYEATVRVAINLGSGARLSHSTHYEALAVARLIVGSTDG